MDMDATIQTTTEAAMQTFLNQKATELEEYRKQKLKAYIRYKNTIGLSIKILKVLMIASLPVCLILPFVIIGTIGLFLVYSYLSSLANPKEDYEFFFKDDILPKLLKKIHPTFEYNSEHINTENLEKSGILKSSFLKEKSKLIGEDHIKGCINKVDVECNEFHFYRIEKNWVKFLFLFITSFIVYPILFIFCIVTENEFGNIGWLKLANKENLYYRGFLMTADFHKSFQGELLLIPKHQNKTVDKLKLNVDINAYKKIELENPHINELYNIYTNSEQEGFYILSPSMLKDIEELCLSNPTMIPMVTFLEGRMNVFIPKKHDSFEINIHTEILNGSFFSSNITDIMVLPRLIEHFNLENRLWSK